ncbi:MAG TPA: hypothetical protein VKF40_16400 [Burkholderiales bacterium]|nr:hypothetical protein [Burkholderiales bacterium]
MSNPEFGLRETLRFLVTAFGCAAVMAGGAPAIAANELASGDTYVYRLVNGYNNEVRGQLHYLVEKVDPGTFTVSVTPDSSWAGVQRVETYTKDGNWLRHQLASHGQNVEYVFESAYPAYVFPLEPGKSWSVRVNAMVPGAATPRSVRVDGTVLGRERIRVPAGEFDTVKIRRVIYPGDAYFYLNETKIIEYDWFAPALGRTVRTDSRSEYIDTSRCGRGGGTCMFRGDWDVFELVDAKR